MKWQSGFPVALLKLIIGSVSSLIFFTGCSFQVNKTSEDGRVGALSLDSFQALQFSIFQPRCLRCHEGANAQGSVDLSTYESIVGHPGLITPGFPETSRLYLEVASGDMPKNDAPLGADQIGAIRQWILAGAPNGSFNASAGDPAPPAPVPPAPELEACLLEVPISIRPSLNF